MVKGLILAFVGFCSGICSVNVAFATSYALLVGVSGYPSLPEKMHLRGPANDTQLMRGVLLMSGFSLGNITVLADSVKASKALPTRANILAELKLLAHRAQPGDWIVIYLSGHGSQQPQFYSGQGYREPDGMDEIFLPYDVTSWNGKVGKVTGALLDDELGHEFEAISRKGTHVWVIFDTCHAGGMSKTSVRFGSEADDGPQWRYVKPADLGIPLELMQRARRYNAEKSVKTRLKPSTNKGMPIGSLVVFSSSQKNEPSAEESLPDILFNPEFSASRNQRFGVFTWYLAQALPKWNGTYSALAEMIDERYRHVRPFPTPLFEGALQINPHLFAPQARVSE